MKPQKLMFNLKDFQQHINLLLLFALNWVVLLPILNTPLGADDIWKSTNHAILKSKNESLISFALSQSQYWIEHGRLFLFSSFTEPYVNAYISNRGLYKVVLVILFTFLSLALYKLVFSISGSKTLASLAWIILLSLSQIRDYFDPKIHFAGSVLISCILNIGALSYLYSVLNQSVRLRTTVPYWFLSILSIFAYEVNFLVLTSIVLISILLYRREFDRKKYLITLAPLVVFTVVALQVRISAKFIESDATINLDVENVFHAFLTQTWGTIPSTEFRGTNVNVLTTKGLAFAIFAILLIVVIGILNTDDVYKNKNISSAMTTPRNMRLLRYMGMSLILLPSVLISLTPRFQIEILEGLPYVVVIYQQLGLALLLVSIIKSNKYFLKQLRGYLIIVFIFVSISTTTISNYFVTEANSPFNSGPMLGNKTFGWDREIVERFASEKLLESGDEVYFYPQRAWTTSAYLSYLSGMKITIPNEPTWWTSSDEQVDKSCNIECENSVIATFEGKDYRSGNIGLADFSNSKFSIEKNRYLSKSGFLYTDGKRHINRIEELCKGQEGKHFLWSTDDDSKLDIKILSAGNYYFLEFTAMGSQFIDPLNLIANLKTCTRF